MHSGKTILCPGPGQTLLFFSTRRMRCLAAKEVVSGPDTCSYAATASARCDHAAGALMGVHGGAGGSVIRCRDGAWIETGLQAHLVLRRKDSVWATDVKGLLVVQCYRSPRSVGRRTTKPGRNAGSAAAQAQRGFLLHYDLRPRQIFRQMQSAVTCETATALYCPLMTSSSPPPPQMKRCAAVCFVRAQASRRPSELWLRSNCVKASKAYQRHKQRYVNTVRSPYSYCGW